MRVPFESTCAPSVASRFPLCVQYVITKFIYLPFLIDLIRRDPKKKRDVFINGFITRGVIQLSMKLS